jgi:hypothetical protein
MIGNFLKETGTLTVDSGIILDNSPNTSAYTAVVFNFTLLNPKTAQESPPTSLFLKLLDKPTGANYPSSFHLPGCTYASSAMTFAAGESSLITSSKDACTTQGGDAKPLRVRGVSWSEFVISQSSPYPCAVANQITLRLKTDGPIFQSCEGSITVSGLLGSNTSDTTNLALANVAGKFSQAGDWKRFTGTLTVQLATNAVLRGYLSICIYNLYI